MIITETAVLTELCHRLAQFPYITLDTEFIRERTYYPELCLIQVAGPGVEACIDPLAPGLDMTALFDLLQNPAVVKVFHAARQDVEIFYHLTGRIPTPLFDTQVAAMVCGYGDNVGYQQLVRDITGVVLDKSMRFTDWSRRPLNTEQVAYALHDVTYLRDVYTALDKQLHETGRGDWLTEEIAVQNDPKTYETDDNEVWHKIKIPFKKPLQTHVFARLCAWRERTAKRKNCPRKHVVKDDALIELALMMPQTAADMEKCRNLPKGFGNSAYGREILAVVAAARQDTPDSYPKNWESPHPLTAAQHALAELLHLLLVIVATDLGVAPRILASADELKQLARGEDDVPCMHGWRRDVFGEKVFRFRRGKLAFGYDCAGRKPRLIETETDQ